jgi:hypothetical protein
MIYQYNKLMGSSGGSIQVAEWVFDVSLYLFHLHSTTPVLLQWGEKKVNTHYDLLNLLFPILTTKKEWSKDTL